MDTSPSILQFAKRFFAGTLLSRFSGFLRDMSTAFCFGSAPEVAAFMVAFRLANLFRRLVGEGNLQSSFIPYFESLQEEGSRRALFFYRDTTISLLCLLLLIVSFLMGGLWGLTFFLSSDWSEIASLAMWMTPGLIFISLYALNAAFLNCQKRYFAPAAAPVFFNLTWIAIAWAGKNLPIRDSIRILAFGVTFALAAQWIVTAIQVKKNLPLSWREWLRPRIFSAEWKQFVKPLILGLVGVGAVQINGLLDAIFSRLADPSGPAFLWYAIRIQQLPLALFGIALAGALLPALSRAIRAGAQVQYKSLLVQGIRHSAALMVPASFGLFALAGSGLNLLYGHGGFHSSDVRETLYCLWGYGIGLLPSVFVLLLATGFYAKRSYGVPTLASLAAMILNGSLNAILVFSLHWGAMSIALATSVAAWMNCFILGWQLSTQIGPIFSSDFWFYFRRLCLAGASAAFLALIAGMSCGEVTLTPEISFTRNPGLQLLQFGVMGAVFAVSFVGGAYVLRLKDFFEVVRWKSAIVEPRP